INKEINIKHLIWQALAPPKSKFFSWLAIQNRIWTCDRLQACGWDNAGQCPLCHHSPESGIHLFAECRFARCIWKEVSSWTATQGLIREFGGKTATYTTGWTSMDVTPSTSKEGLHSLISVGRFGRRETTAFLTNRVYKRRSSSKNQRQGASLDSC
ncbi:LOW QUALITY PROTEIN: hypothetical protein U9M48_036657, partial [Paspalum notatum var. saurae]